jgi:hypothetical protein
MGVPSTSYVNSCTFPRNTHPQESVPKFPTPVWRKFPGCWPTYEDEIRPRFLERRFREFEGARLRTTIDKVA